jgi:hypothetical protein
MPDPLLCCPYIGTFLPVEMMEFEQLKDKILTLFREDQEFRYAIAGLLGWEEILRRLDRHEEELSRLSRETAELRKETTELRKETTELRKEMTKLRQDMMEGFQLVHRQLSALGARWGLMSERAFREGLRGLLERELGLRVEKWARMDREGRVFGHPGRVEVDVAVRDGKVVLVEVKSHVGRADVYSFRRKAEFYEKVGGKKPSRLLMVTPYAEREALRTARHLGVEIYTGV